jgi:hypothetical protein
MMALRADQDGAPVAANDQPATGRRRIRGELAGSPSFGGTGACMLPEAVEAWAKAAATGDELIYAEGHLPPWAKAPRLLRDFHGDGLVGLTIDHKATPKLYIAQRTAEPWPVAQKQRRRVGRQIPNKDPQLAELLELLEEWAAKGEPCRTNSAIARLLGIADRVRVSYLFRCLVGEGLIRNRPIVVPPYRIITIVKSGQSTGLAVSP